MSIFPCTRIEDLVYINILLDQSMRYQVTLTTSLANTPIRMTPLVLPSLYIPVTVGRGQILSWCQSHLENRECPFFGLLQGPRERAVSWST